MVGNAELVKEYNYRPLSKLGECQLDVNDKVSIKLRRWGQHRAGRPGDRQDWATPRAPHGQWRHSGCTNRWSFQDLSRGVAIEGAEVPVVPHPSWRGNAKKIPVSMAKMGAGFFCRI